MNKIYNIGVLDDHALILQAIEGLLIDEKSYNYSKGFSTYKMLYHFLEEGNTIDILLLDIQLNNEDGIKICTKLRESFPEIIIIMLSSITQAAVVMDAFNKGANGFLPKNIDKTTLIQAFKETLEGKTYIHKDISLLSQKSKSSKFDYIPKLSRREKEVLELILDEMTTPEIAEKLCISPSTVETHRSSLFSKTGSKNVVGLIKFTLEKGLLD